MVLSTALFDRPAFKNLICNGLVLAADGKKMSKSLKNYPDPNEVIDKYGADALRLYLINSPVVRAEPLRFKEDGVFAVLKDVFLPWYNAYRFLIQNISRVEAQTNTPFIPIDDTNELSNPLDRWILGASGSLIDFITNEMQGYRLYTVVPRLIEFIEQLTNIYVRYNRIRLKGDDRDSFLAMNTLFIVLLSLCKAMAPFTPFFVESMYQNLKKCLSGAEQSIHFCDFPNAPDIKYDVELQTSVSRMQNAIEMGRVIRERRNKPLKLPLARAIIAHTDNTFLQKISSDLRSYVVSELNVRDVEVSNDVMAYVTQKAAPNFATLGKRLGKSMKTVKNAVENMTNAEISLYKKCGMVELAGFTLDRDDILLKYDFSEKLSESRDAICDADGLILILDLETDQSLLDEGLAREVVNRVQKMRKSSGLQLRDAVLISYSILKHNDSDATFMLNRIFEDGEKHFKEALGTVPKDESSFEVEGVVIAEEDVVLSTGASVSFKLFRPMTTSTESGRRKGIDAYLKNRDLALLEAQLPSLKIELDGEAIFPSIQIL